MTNLKLNVSISKLPIHNNKDSLVLHFGGGTKTPQITNAEVGTAPDKKCLEISYS